MKLVACQNCHAQYDVTDVLEESFACRCGETVRSEVHKAVDAEIHRCGSCGAIVSAEASGCEFCGSEIVRDDERLSLICPECYARNADEARFCGACGVAFQPEPVRADGHELPCPDCGNLMPPTAIGGVGVNECPTCHGIWVPGDRFDHLVARAIEAHQSPSGPAARHVPRVKQGTPTAGGVRYRKCPECDGFMRRQNFRKTSGVIIDTCREHGTWLDADELEQIAGFILSGGRPNASATLADLEARDERVAREARKPIGMSASSSFEIENRSRSGISLLGLLSNLLD